LERRKKRQEKNMIGLASYIISLKEKAKKQEGPCVLCDKKKICVFFIIKLRHGASIDFIM